jgi:hypothetical protein
MKKVNVKSLVIFGVLGVVMVLVVLAISQVRTFMSGATSGVEPQSVTVVSGDDGKSAVINWISDKESLSKIEYGTTAASLVLMSAESSAVTNHSVSLTSLRPATTYYFRIKVGDEVFDNGGIPYTFKTKADTTLVTVTPTVAAVTPSVGSSNGAVCDPKIDYNKDGIVNSMDLAACKNSGGSVATSSVTPTKSTTSTTGVSCTGNIADYNSDGVVNSLDRINCLQNQ